MRCHCSGDCCPSLGSASAGDTQQQESGRSNQQNRPLLSTRTDTLSHCLWENLSSELFEKTACHLAATTIVDPLGFSLSSLYDHFQSAAATIHTLNVISPSLSAGVTALRISSSWQLSQWTKWATSVKMTELDDKQMSNSHISDLWENFAECKVSLWL